MVASAVLKKAARTCLKSDGSKIYVSITYPESHNVTVGIEGLVISRRGAVQAVAIAHVFGLRLRSRFLSLSKGR